MATLTSDVISSATSVYSISTADPVLYVPEDRLIWKTGGTGRAINIVPATGVDILIAGTVRSSSSGIGASPVLTGETVISLTTRAYMETDGYGIVLSLSGAILRVGNAGTMICGNAGVHVNSNASTYITNTGTIATAGINAIQAIGTGEVFIVNAGSIVGDVRLDSGDDRINTANGTITGTIYGGEGSDTYVIGAQDVEIREQAGEGTGDTVYASASHVLADNIEDLFLRGGARDGTGNAENNDIYGNKHANVLMGLGGDDDLQGDAGNDRLDGGAGTDFLGGGAGFDTLLGGDGDDRIYVSGDSDTVNGGAGFDTVDFGDEIALTIDLTAGTATGGHLLTSIENADGGALNDTISGSSIANSLYGEGGDDVLLGLGGNDILLGSDGADTMNGGEGADIVGLVFVSNALTIDMTAGTATGDASTVGDVWVSIEGVYAGLGNDSITGSAAANVINGNAGNDVISGMGGGDAIEGWSGDDTLTGGASNDRFVFGDTVAGGGGWGSDTITDFTNGGDRIDFRTDSRVANITSLTFAQNGADVVITVGADTITLSNTQLAVIDASDFLFA